jgi:hypothetical protein
MTFFVRAVVTGFALSLGAAVFKKVQGRLGLAEDKPQDKSSDDVVTRDAATDPSLQDRTR